MFSFYLITDLDREIHKRFSEANSFDDMYAFYRWMTYEKYLSMAEVMESVKKVETDKTIKCILICIAVPAVIWTIIYTSPYLWGN